MPLAPAIPSQPAHASVSSPDAALVPLRTRIRRRRHQSDQAPCKADVLQVVEKVARATVLTDQRPANVEALEPTPLQQLRKWWQLRQRRKRAERLYPAEMPYMGRLRLIEDLWTSIRRPSDYVASAGYWQREPRQLIVWGLMAGLSVLPPVLMIALFASASGLWMPASLTLLAVLSACAALGVARARNTVRGKNHRVARLHFALVAMFLGGVAATLITALGAAVF